MFGLGTVVLAALTMVPVQPEETDPDLTRVRAALLEKVRITDVSGAQQTAILWTVKANELTLMTGDGPVALDASTVRRIEVKGDSLANGAAIGAAFGVVIGLLAGQGYDHLGIEWVIGTAFASGFYALVGAGLDALHVGWTTVAEGKTRKVKSQK